MSSTCAAISRPGAGTAKVLSSKPALFLEALMRLHCGRYLVLNVDLQSADLIAFDTALAVHEVDVVVIAGTEVDSHCLCCAGAVALETEDKLLLLGLRRTGGDEGA